MMIRLATRDDVPALMAMEARNYVGNLDPSQRSEGFISILHPQRWFTSAVDTGGVHVAVDDDGSVAGFIAVTAPPTGSDVANASPIVQAMLGLTATLSYLGTPIAQQRFALRGPVLIDRGARGRGLYSAFNEVTRDAYSDRFAIGVLFVAADNPRSVHTTITKLGAESLAIFDVDSKPYHFMAFTF